MFGIPEDIYDNETLINVLSYILYIIILFIYGEFLEEGFSFLFLFLIILGEISRPAKTAGKLVSGKHVRDW